MPQVSAPASSQSAFRPLLVVEAAVSAAKVPEPPGAFLVLPPAPGGWHSRLYNDTREMGRAWRSTGSAARTS